MAAKAIQENQRILQICLTIHPEVLLSEAEPRRGHDLTSERPVRNTEALT